MSSPELRVVLSEIGGIVVGVESSRVELAAGEPDREAIDLAVLWKLATPVAPRRALALRRRDRRKAWVVLGERAKLVRLPAAARLDLPCFVEALATRAGLDAVLRLDDDGLAYLLDVDRLTSSAAGTPS